ENVVQGKSYSTDYGASSHGNEDTYAPLDGGCHIREGNFLRREPQCADVALVVVVGDHRCALRLFPREAEWNVTLFGGSRLGFDRNPQRIAELFGVQDGLKTAESVPRLPFQRKDSITRLNTGLLGRAARINGGNLRR